MARRRNVVMNERWVPVLAAVVGVLGGMGGALVGGSVANEGQLQRFETERAAQVQDMRVEAYVDFLGAIDDWHFHGGTEEEVITALAKVTLLCSPPLREPAIELGDAAVVAGKEGTDEQWETYFRQKNAFLDLAQQEIDQ
jgi:hypothetical protein